LRRKNTEKSVVSTKSARKDFAVEENIFVCTGLFLQNKAESMKATAKQVRIFTETWIFSRGAELVRVRVDCSTFGNELRVDFKVWIFLFSSWMISGFCQ